MKTFFISDLHFGHKNIILYENRPFSSIDDMNKGLIKNINDTVQPDDQLFILGDFAFCNGSKIQEFRNKIRCRTVHLVMGNHDRHHPPQWWREKGFSEVYNYPIIFNNFLILSHEPQYMNNTMPYVNVHGHTHSTKLSGRYFNACVECNDYTPFPLEKITNLYKHENEVQDLT
jgi:calcineurin-like phosphoesterase family protein